ncbi:MAG: hypothetical protein JXL67_13760 [Calditrichaeota bacterium]|nr:hypothetical protein [Calditrichota bacterium]
MCYLTFSKAKLIVLLVIILFNMNILMFAQPASVPFHTVEYSIKTDIYDGHQEKIYPELMWQDTIKITDAPWVRVRFGKVNLGKDSYLQINSLKDSSTQHINSKILMEWYNYSAYFNGDLLEIKLFVGPLDRGIFCEITEIIVGDYQNEAVVIESICGTEDDRVRSYDPAVGRLLTSQLSIYRLYWMDCL